MIARENLLELRENGYCVLRTHLPKDAINACREAFWPVLLAYLSDHKHQPNRGPHRHFLPMPFERPCFAPEFFFDADILGIVRGAMSQWTYLEVLKCRHSSVPSTRSLTLKRATA
jgi:hypothetical protein